jgi:RND family efflux transporter MFP subunit
VKVAPVALGDLERTYKTTGTVEASTETDVAAKVEQRIIALPFREGDAVKAGAVVARLDASEAQQQLEIAAKEFSIAQAQLRDLLAGARPEEIAQAKAGYDQALATVRKAEQALAHARELYGTGGIPAQAIDAARGKMEVAQSQYSAAQASYENAQQNYQHIKDQVELNAEPRLRVEEAQGRVKSAEAQVAVTQTALEDARRDLNRIAQLRDIGGASQESVDKAQDRVATYEAQLNAARAAADAARSALARAQEILDLNAGPQQQLDDARTKLQAAESQLKAAKQAAQAAQEDYLHVLALYSGPIPQREIDDAAARLAEARSAAEAARKKWEEAKAGPTSTQVAVARERVAQAAAKLRAAQVALSYCTVTAPVSGTVIRRMLDVGDMAGPRAPILTLATASHAVVKAALPDKYAEFLQVGTPAQVKARQDPRAVPASVTRVYGAADSRTRLMPFEIALPPELRWPPGAMVEVSLTLEKASQVPVVPSDALLSRPDGKRVVFVVEDGKAVERAVVVGIEAEGKAQIKEGLRPGEMLVTAGNDMLKNNMEVNIAQPKEKGGSGAEAGSKAGSQPMKGGKP